VYSDWIDAAEVVGKVGAERAGGDRDDEYEDDGAEASAV
jgi:transcription elongation factor Elf1